MNENELPGAAGTGPAPVLPGLTDNRKKLLWTVLSALLAAGSIWAVSTQWKGFSLAAFASYVAEADDRWLAAAGLAMLSYIFFEGQALRSACRALGFPVSAGSGFSYASADIYFSAVTPSATGGQPACALLMIRSGIPGMVTTAALLLTLGMYALSTLVIGLLTFLLRPAALLRFAPVSRVLIAAGYLLQILLALLLFMLLRSERLLERLCAGTLELLARLRLIRRAEERRARLRVVMEEYRDCAAILSGRRRLLIRSFLFNLLHRASQIAVTPLVYLAMGGSLRQAADVFALQSCVAIGAHSAPIPGAMGVVDFLMLDAFGSVFPPDRVVSLELLSRSISFYLCVPLCGVVFLFAYRRARRR